VLRFFSRLRIGTFYEVVRSSKRLPERSAERRLRVLELGGSPLEKLVEWVLNFLADQPATF
jgi:hypothetical protein